MSFPIRMCLLITLLFSALISQKSNGKQLPRGSAARNFFYVKPSVFVRTINNNPINNIY